MSQFLCWLPPNLQPSSFKQSIPLLFITIQQFSYLNLGSTKPQTIKYNWWGLKAKPIFQHLQQRIHRFPISVSKEMFLRYCRDMKILQFQLCDVSGICISKGFINFMLFKNWNGELMQIVVDLKNNKNVTKIGQLRLSMQIIDQGNNPLYKIPQINPQTIYKNNGQLHPQLYNKKLTQNSQKQKNKNSTHNIQQNRNQNKTVQYNRKYRANISQQKKQESDYQYNNFIQFNDDYDRSRNQEIQRNKKINDRKQNIHKCNVLDTTRDRLFKKLDLPVSDKCICNQLNPNKFNIEKIRLKEQLQLFFNNPLTQNTQNVTLQLINWQPLTKTERNLPIKITIPVIDSSGNILSNQYTFGKGKGIIQLNIDSKGLQQNKLKEFLINNQVQIRVGDVMNGSVSLAKILGSRGNVVSVSVFESSRNKREVLKGHCLMKVIQQKSTIEKNNNKQQNRKQSYQNTKKQNNIQQNNSKQIEIKQQIEKLQQYIWLYIKQIHFLEPQYHKDSNTFIKIQYNKQNIYKSKTKWHTNTPIFNQIVTIKSIKNSKNNYIYIQVWNRQATQRLTGNTQLQIQQNIQQYSKQIAINDNYGRVIGYLNVCMGKGGLSAATQFINTHANYFMQRTHHNNNSNHSNNNNISNKHRQMGSDQLPSTYRKHQQNQQQYPQNQYQRYNQPSHQQQQQQQQYNNNNSKYSNKQEQQNHQIPPNKYHKQQQLTLLQIHNKIFTNYINKSYDWLQNYQNNQLTIAEFTQLVKPLFYNNNIQYTTTTNNNMNITKLISVYLNSKNNKIILEQVKQSYQAFNVYYQILRKQRDNILLQIIQYLHNQGLLINDIQNNRKQKIKINNNRIINNNNDNMWRAFKQCMPANLVQKLRYFYQRQSLEEICDRMRKFQVYETTNGEQIYDQLISRELLKQICDILEIDEHVGNIRSQIDQAGLELSKYQLLSLFGEVQSRNSPSKMIKSPTFGLLGTQRINNNHNQINNNMIKNMKVPQNNPSIDIRLNPSKYLQQNSLQQKFGNPRISPINQQNSHITSQVTLRFSNFEEGVNKINVNQQQITLKMLQIQQSFILEIQKEFNYEGYIITMTNKKLQFDGPAGQWIGLVDEQGNYCGCLCFQ